jgi:hypothetical protein
MDEPTRTVGSTGIMDRRDMLRRGVVVAGAAALWTTPVVQTLGMRAAAAGTHDEVVKDSFCPPPGSPNDRRATRLVFAYLGSTASKIEVRATGPGGPGGASDPVTTCWENVTTGQTVEVGRSGGINDVSFTVDGDTFSVHTSCSERPFECGMTFGVMQLVGGTNYAGIEPCGSVSATAASADCDAIGSTEESEEAELKATEEGEVEGTAEGEVEGSAEGEVEGTDTAEVDHTEEAEKAGEELKEALEGGVDPVAETGESTSDGG